MVTVRGWIGGNTISVPKLSVLFHFKISIFTLQTILFVLSVDFLAEKLHDGF